MRTSLMERPTASPNIDPSRGAPERRGKRHSHPSSSTDGEETASASSRVSVSSRIATRIREHIGVGMLLALVVILMGTIPVGAANARDKTRKAKPRVTSRCGASRAHGRLRRRRPASGCRRVHGGGAAHPGRHHPRPAPTPAPPTAAPPPSTPPPPTVAPPPGTAPPPTWFGTFSGAGGCADASLYPMENPGVGSGLACVPDPNGSGQTVLQMTVTNSTCAWSCEQRMDWDSPRNLVPGGDYYFSVPILIPTSFPNSIGGNGHLVQFEEVFGMPTSGSPSQSINVCQSGSSVVFCANNNTTGSAGGGQHVWLGSAAANDGKWHDFIFHEVMSTSASTGELQMWEDGNPITFNGPDCGNSSSLSGCGTTTIHYPTLIPGATTQTNNWLQINNYRNTQGIGTTPLYHGAPAWGATYASVARTIVRYPYGP